MRNDRKRRLKVKLAYLFVSVFAGVGACILITWPGVPGPWMMLGVLGASAISALTFGLFEVVRHEGR